MISLTHNPRCWRIADRGAGCMKQKSSSKGALRKFFASVHA